MARDYPHSRSADGQNYVCGNCGQTLPDGVMVLAHYTAAGKVTGVRAETTDGQVRHECGTKVAKGEGQHGEGI